jgi:hypothetical protein
MLSSFFIPVTQTKCLDETVPLWAFAESGFSDFTNPEIEVRLASGLGLLRSRRRPRCFFG